MTDAEKDSARDFRYVLESVSRDYLGLTNNQVKRLVEHFRMLWRWNDALNLTGPAGLEEGAIRHFWESLFLGLQLPTPCGSIADIGSGAGFPGVPIAILRPDCRVTLIESDRRKAVFLRECTRNWRNVRVLGRRAEGIDETFDWLVSRALRARAITSLVPRMAPRLGRLIGEREAQTLKSTESIEWDEPVPVPFSERTYVAIGRCVPRETGGGRST